MPEAVNSLGLLKVVMRNTFNQLMHFNLGQIQGIIAMAFTAIEKLHRLHDGYKQTVSVQGKQLLLIQDRNQVYLVENRCPHMDAPLTYATINNGFIRCPMHGIEFSLRDGQSKTGVGGCLKKYPVAYEGNQIGIAL